MSDELFVIAETREWAKDALCQGRQEFFFAPPGERRTRRAKREALARSYCNNCHALFACRSWARENREHGFWGGEGEEQRAALGYPPRSPSRRAVAEMGRNSSRPRAETDVDSEILAG
jgi:WhiB family redox-sensing transcriptional regulator